MKKELGYGSSLPGKSTYLPIVTDDEGKPAVKPDVFIDDKIYSEAEMVSLFQVSNPGRKTREEMDFFPPLTRQNADGYYIMFDRANTIGGEPLAVGRVGWKYLPEHKLYLTTGIKVIDMYRGLGLSRSLWQKRDSAVIKNTPAIGMASNFSESWLKLIQSEGWKVDPPVESLPESIQDEVRETIAGDKPRRLISKNIDMAMKKAWEILKMPRGVKYSGPDIRNEAQYEAASLEERRAWHLHQQGAYHLRLKVLQRNHTVDLTDTENPLYKEMKSYQDLRNFHGRQGRRINQVLNKKPTRFKDYYSLELETNDITGRQKQKLKTTPTGFSDTYKELSLEEYNNLTQEQKFKYHNALFTKYRNDEKNKELSQFHSRMKQRVKAKTNSPTFPSPEHGGESIYGLETTKEQYDNMDDTNKKKYHSRMKERAKRDNNLELEGFHRRMYFRIRNNSPLPTFYSPEHEQEEE